MAPIVSDEYKEKKRKEILSSALACFAKKGFEAATIDDIVHHSGISKGAIYNYFSSKDEIYLELMNRETLETNNDLTNNIAQYSSALEKINYLFDVYLAINPFDEKNSEDVIVHYEFKIYSSRNKDVNTILNQRRHEYFIKLISDILEVGKENAEIKSDIDSSLFANVFWSMLDGATIQTLYKDYPYHDAIKEMKKMFMNSIRM